MIWYMIWYDMIWSDMIWYDVIWYDMIYIYIITYIYIYDIYDTHIYIYHIIFKIMTNPYKSINWDHLPGISWIPGSSIIVYDSWRKIHIAAKKPLVNKPMADPLESTWYLLALGSTPTIAWIYGIYGCSSTQTWYSRFWLIHIWEAESKNGDLPLPWRTFAPLSRLMDLT